MFLLYGYGLCKGKPTHPKTAFSNLPRTPPTLLGLDLFLLLLWLLFSFLVASKATGFPSTWNVSTPNWNHRKKINSQNISAPLQKPPETSTLLLFSYPKKTSFWRVVNWLSCGPPAAGIVSAVYVRSDFLGEGMCFCSGGRGELSHSCKPIEKSTFTLQDHPNPWRN